MIDSDTLVMQGLRWIHYLAGIIWIGLLYFFNLINVHLAKTYDPATKKAVVPQLMPRALFWFRWGAMFTFLSGWLYVAWKIFIASDAGFFGPGGLMASTWGYWISLGGLFGTIMWFNVWFIIWPNQKGIIEADRTGNAPADLQDRIKKATLASRINTYLSVPLLFAMAAASHFPVFTWGWLIGVLVVSFAIAHHVLKAAEKVSIEIKL